MFDQTRGIGSVQNRLKLLSYQTLYRNALSRLCRVHATLSFDFITSAHEGVGYLQRFRQYPTKYICRTDAGESSCLVIARNTHLVALREPREPGETFLFVWDGIRFVPCEEEATEYWQRYIEPCAAEEGNVLPQEAVDVPGLHGWMQKGASILRPYHGLLLVANLGFLDQAVLPWLA